MNETNLETGLPNAKFDHSDTRIRQSQFTYTPDWRWEYVELSDGGPCYMCQFAEKAAQRAEHEEIVSPRAENVSSSPLAQNSPISVNGHLLYSEQNCSVFHDSDKQCPVHEGGLAVCRLCGEYEAGLDQPCRKAVKPQKPTINPYEYLKTFKYPPEQPSEQPIKYSPVIEQAFRCWNEHRAYVDDDDNYRVKRKGSIRGPVASWNRAVKELFPSYREFHAVAQEFENAPNSPALRRGRSILHHAELVEERRRTQLTFEQEWQSAPKSIKHGCEETSAEFFYHAGRRDRETEMLQEVNEVLSGVVGRIKQERVR